MATAPRFSNVQDSDAVRLDRNEALFPMSVAMKQRVAEVTAEVSLA